MTAVLDIIDAIRDEKLFRPFLGDDLSTWEGWVSALSVVYGLPVLDKSQRKLVFECTGVPIDSLNDSGFSSSLFLTGRRSGKSRIAAVIGAYESAIAVHGKKLSKGEKGVVAVLAPSKTQAQIVKGYLRAIFEPPSILHESLLGETRDGFDLEGGVRIQIMAGDWRTVRGFSLLSAIVDEACFFGYDIESKVRSDSELIRALQPGLATTNGKLVCISSPYATKGWCYEQWKRNFGNPKATTLVWNCPSRTMNPSLPQRVVDDAMAEDRLAAMSEYMGKFRDDVSEYLPFSLLESRVVKGRGHLEYSRKYQYRAFVDMSGGRADDAALAIAHREDRLIILDVIKGYPSPFSPQFVIEDIASILRDYGIHVVTGDNYAAEFVAERFQAVGIRYRRSPKPKNELYADLIPWLCSGEIELLDAPLLIKQFSNLERRTRSGGRDVIDHPRGGHDDLANVVAGVADCLSNRNRRTAKAI